MTRAHHHLTANVQATHVCHYHITASAPSALLSRATLLILLCFGFVFNVHRSQKMGRPDGSGASSERGRGSPGGPLQGQSLHRCIAATGRVAVGAARYLDRGSFSMFAFSCLLTNRGHLGVRPTKAPSSVVAIMLSTTPCF